MCSTRQAVLGLVMCSVAGSATAKVLVWELHNVRFDDGGSASGFFTIDTRIPGLIANFDVKTTGGRNNPSFHYTPKTTAGAVNRLVSDGILLGQGKRNQLEISAGLNPAGDSSALLSPGTLPLAVDPSREFLFPDDVFRHILPGGSISAIPEPSSVAALLAGLVALVVARLRARLSGPRRSLE